MARMTVYMDDEELAFAKQQNPGFVRNCVRRFMEAKDPMSDDEMAFVRRQGGIVPLVRRAMRKDTADVPVGAARLDAVAHGEDPPAVGRTQTITPEQYQRMKEEK